LVDDTPNVQGYKSVGFNVFDPKNAEGGQIGLQAPDIGGVRRWMQYLSNVMMLSPIDPTRIPPKLVGVLMQGGTYVVNRNSILYQWNDRYPGDLPGTDEVMSFV